MATNAKIKVIKRGSDVRAIKPAFEKRQKLSTAQIVSGWIAEFRANKDAQRQKALELLFG